MSHGGTGGDEMSLSTLIAVSAQLWLLWYAVRAVTQNRPYQSCRTMYILRLCISLISWLAIPLLTGEFLSKRLGYMICVYVMLHSVACLHISPVSHLYANTKSVIARVLSTGFFNNAPDLSTAQFANICISLHLIFYY